MSTIATFLAAAGFKGLKNWIWIVIVAAVVAGIWAFVAIADRRHENALEIAAEGGAAGAIVAGQQQTLDQLGDANNAEQDLRSAGDRSQLAHDECLRNNRNKRSCDDLRPLP